MFVVCTLTAIFLDRFLWNFVWRRSLVKYLIMCCLQCSNLYSVKGHVSCVHSNSHISRQISLKFCMKAYLGKNLHAYIFWLCAAPSVPIYIVSKVIFVVYALPAGYPDRFCWNFVGIYCMYILEYLHTSLYNLCYVLPPCDPIFIVSKVMLVACALTVHFLSVFF